MNTVKIFKTKEFLASGNSLNHYGLTPYETKGDAIVTAATVNLPEGVTVEGDHFCLDGEKCELYEHDFSVRIRVRVEGARPKVRTLCRVPDFKLA